jgi:multidrug efflux pump subunit AcrB
MLVALKQGRRRGIEAVLEDLRGRIGEEVPSATVEFVQVMQDTLNDLAGNPEPIEIKLLGTEYPALQRAADRVVARLEGMKKAGVREPKSTKSFGSPELVVRPDPPRLAAAGVDPGALASQLRAQLLGDVVAQMQEGERLVDVRVRYAAGWRVDDAFGERPPPLFALRGRGRTPVPVDAVAAFDRVLSENELERENQVPMVRVTAGVAGTDLGTASAAVRAAVQAMTFEPGVRVEFDGQQKSQQSQFERLLLVAAVGIGLVFLLLVVQFRSLRLPLAIFLALPFGQLGALLTLQLCGTALNLSSAMGLVLLIGLLVKNGIILIECSQQLARGGADATTALVQAARLRLRPILMTTLAAIAGLLPLALGLGAGAELQRPLAIAVIGGLAVATLATLFVVPLGCALFAGDRLAGERLGEEAGRAR